MMPAMHPFSAPINLRARARQALLDARFLPDFPAEIEAELRRATAAADPSDVVDMRDLLWSSIDNEESRDLDQVEYATAEPDGTIRLLIGIADVDVFAPRDRALDQHAAINTTSIYTGVATFPMLPRQLSTALSSLLENQDRMAMVVDLRVKPSGAVITQGVSRARVRNRAKLVYESIGAWLDGRAEAPPLVAASAGLEKQIRLQHAAAERLRDLRQAHGSLTLGAIEPKAVMRNDRIVDLQIAQSNPAREIIESFMIAVNVATAELLNARGFASIRRVVRAPRRWDRIVDLARQRGQALPAEPDAKALADFLARQKQADPLRFPDLSLAVVKSLGPGEYTMQRPGAEAVGHFGLALHDYTHSTAPNRRYPDLIIQRLLKAVIAGKTTPYTDARLLEIAAHCTEREDAVRKIERLMRKVIAAATLSSRIGEAFEAVVTGASPKGTYVRLLRWPAEGRVVRGEQGIDVGDLVRVRLVATNPERGFIDFERLR